MNGSLLPNNTLPYERVNEDSFAARWETFSGGAAAIKTAKLASPPSSFLPYLVWEYGLGELTPYVPNLYNLIEEGISWQRVRGTLKAIDLGLSWIDYTASVEEAWSGRNWWNSYQLRFSELPRNDDPDLERIEVISTLSVPKRSQLRRGVFQYDVEAAVLDWSRLDRCMLDQESGVRVKPDGAIWSFGRTFEIAHLLTEEEGVRLGNWIDPPENSDPLFWVDMLFPWVTANFPWASNAEAQRQSLMAAFFVGKSVFAELKGEDGDVIGYRRCRAARPSAPVFNGAYTFASLSYSPVPGGKVVYFEAMTDFEDAEGVTAESISLLVEPILGINVPIGRLWLKPGDLSGGTRFATTEISIPLRATVRDQFKFLVRF